MNKHGIFAILLLTLVSAPLIYYIIQKQTVATHYYVIEGGNQEGVDVGPGVIRPNPKIVALLAEKPGCLYCEVVKNDILKYPIILKVFNMNDPQDYQLFISYLQQAGLEYQGVPTLLIGRMVFYSYLDSDTCPNGYISETIAIGNEKIQVCALADHPRYYIYMPSVVSKIIQACLKYKDPVCFGP